MSTEASILARLERIEALLEKLAGGQGEQPPQDASGISASRRMEIILMAAEANRVPGRKKKSPAEVRA